MHPRARAESGRISIDSSKNKGGEKKMKKRILSILTLLCLVASLMPAEALAVPSDPPPPTYPVYSYGTRVMLTENSVWLVLEDPGSESAQFTLVMDGFLAGTCSKAAVDTTLSDYQTTAR